MITPIQMPQEKEVVGNTKIVRVVDRKTLPPPKSGSPIPLLERPPPLCDQATPFPLKKGKRKLSQYGERRDMRQVDIDGHPPLPLTHNSSPGWQFFMVFWVLKFRGCFKALNSVILAIFLRGPCLGLLLYVVLNYIFLTGYHEP